MHKRSHVGERPFECSIKDCKKKFLSKEQLKRHTTIHSGLRPYECSFEGCVKAFNRRSTLNVSDFTCVVYCFFLPFNDVIICTSIDIFRSIKKCMQKTLQNLLKPKANNFIVLSSSLFFLQYFLNLSFVTIRVRN